MRCTAVSASSTAAMTFSIERETISASAAPFAAFFAFSDVVTEICSIAAEVSSTAAAPLLVRSDRSFAPVRRASWLATSLEEVMRIPEMICSRLVATLLVLSFNARNDPW